MTETAQKEMICVSVNGEPRSTLGDVAASDGDSFEIVHFVGGG
jgi:sulfur carrier protein ThiS